MTVNELIHAAADYRASGLCVLPAMRAEKRPAIGGRWEPYKTRLPTEDEIRKWFETRQDALCLVCGDVSGNLEMIDFDFAGELFEPWREKVEAAAPGLTDRLVIESTQSSGWHAVYRCGCEPCGNIKLAQRKRPVSEEEVSVEDDGREYIRLEGKKYAARADADGARYVLITLIETRGEGGLFLCAPTEGYEVVQGDLREVPVLTAAERDTLLQAAWDLNEYTPHPINGPSLPDTRTDAAGSTRPGDEFNERGDIRPVLRDHGWTLVRPGSNQYWRRPGKDEGWSASYNGEVFYCFTSNAPPFEMSRGYSRFAVYALLEHNGDYAGAASALSREGYGSDPCGAEDTTVDISGIVCHEPAADQEHLDPGPIPDRLLYVPGFIDDVMTYTMETAPYPNRALAFGSALAVQGHLAGRKIQDELGTRTNLYILTLAPSGTGKERPRKVNQLILLRAGAPEQVGDAFASGEGIEDCLHAQPCMLFQTDEFDKWLLAHKRGEHGRYEKVMEILLKMYTSADGIYPMRVKADQEHRFIHQPSLSIMGSAIPLQFYAGLSMPLLTNGFFARLLIIEAGERGYGQQPSIKPVPAGIIEVAKAWFEPLPDAGDLDKEYPDPPLVKITDAARERYREVQRKCDDHYRSASPADEAARALWARAYEKVRRLALVYACSENHTTPCVTAKGVQWAWEFTEHQTRRMLYMAQRYVFENEFEERSQQLLDYMADYPARWVPYWKIGRKFRGWSDKEKEELIENLVNSLLVVQKPANPLRPGPTGRLIGLADTINEE